MELEVAETHATQTSAQAFWRAPRSWQFQQQLIFGFSIVVLFFVVLGSLFNSWLAYEKFLTKYLSQGVQITSGFARESTLALLYGIGENALEAANTTLGFPDVMQVSIYDRDGLRLFRRGAETDWTSSLSYAQVPRQPTLVNETKDVWHFVSPVFEQSTSSAPESPFESAVTTPNYLGYVHVALEKSSLQIMRKSIFIENMLSTLVFAGILLLLVQWLTSRITQPLGELAKLMKRAEQGEAGVRAASHGSSEILKMGQAFNTMMSVLEERRRKLDDQNHQLLQEMEDRKQAQQALHESATRLRTVIESVADGIVTMTESGEIESMNPAAQELFHYQHNTALGMNIQALIATSSRTNHRQSLLDQKLDKNNPEDKNQHLEFTGLRRDGSEFIIDQSISKMQLAGRCLLIAVIRDITEKKHAEQELLAYRDHLQELVDEQTRDLIVTRDKALAAERAMSAFLANMSHEIRTPLHGIISFSRFGIKKYQTATPEKLQGYFQEIHDSGQNLLDLLTSLLDLSKLKAGKMVYDYTDVDIVSIALGVSNEFLALQMEKSINIIVDSNIPEIHVYADPIKISQVLRNLLSNAVKFSPNESEIRINITRNGDQAGVAVMDQGCGIPPNELEFIFDSFTQSSKTDTHAGGTGLGLAISKEIIEVGHLGWIRAANNPERGACFTFQIPIGHSVNE